MKRLKTFQEFLNESKELWNHLKIVATINGCKIYNGYNSDFKETIDDMDLLKKLVEYGGYKNQDLEISSTYNFIDDEDDEEFLNNMDEDINGYPVGKLDDQVYFII